MAMNRRDFLKSIGVGTATLAGSRILGEALPLDQEKTNIILINVDDLGWMDLSCYGSGYYETPHIDQLAAQGMKFTNGYASCAVCSPTRASCGSLWITSCQTRRNMAETAAL